MQLLPGTQLLNILITCHLFDNLLHLGIHNHLGIRNLFQLRVSLSSLRSHKRRHNFIAIPSDICHCNQNIEDASHFLFSCPYSTQRSSLATSVSEIILKNNLSDLGNQLQLYLYGHTSV